jgi:uncharacterized membrane protein YfcA
MTTILFLGVLVGAVLGLTGAGGGIFAVPALVFGMGWSVMQASPIALLAVAGAAAVGAIEGLRQGLVRYKAAALMSVTGIAITSLGVRTAHALSGEALLLAFAAAMILVAIRMYRAGGNQPAAADLARPPPCKIDPTTGRLHWTPRSVAAISAVGLLSGFLTGLLGVGGGFVIVPELRQISDVSIHGIIATSLLVIALVAGGAVLVAWWHGAALPLNVTIPFVVSTATGMLIGRRLVRHLPAALLQRSFAVLMGVVAVSFVVKATKI